MATSSASDPSPSAFFDDDDEETLRYLAANESGDSNLSSRLESLVERFKEDHHDHSKHENRWNEFVDSAKSSGFQLAESGSSQPPLSSSDAASTAFPSAFESDTGKQHIRATASLLNVSERRAVQLTMSSLRTLNETTNLQALLGTRTLLEKVMEYHVRQRTARLSALTECLRKEQDADASDQNTIIQELDSLDATYTDEGFDRGLFRYLLSIACQREDGQSPSREQLLPAKELNSDNPSSSLQASFARSSEEAAWHQFVARCLNSNRNRIYQERLAAMEGLVVLLYHRVQGGVRRVDCMLVLLAFQSTKSFFRSAEGNRLSQLAGLICAECMGLWRVLEENSEDVNWLSTHPLMDGVLSKPSGQPNDSSQRAETELEALRMLVLKCAGEVNEKDAHESLALLSFGLLFLLAYNSILPSSFGADQAGYWQIFGEKGQAMVEMASEKYSALDYLCATMDTLVAAPSKRNIEDGDNELPYDWLFSGKEIVSPMEIEDGSEMGSEMDAGSLTYASIGHEILIALVVAFEGTILSVDHAAACQNLAMVCDLASRIYRNSPILCEPFWTGWEIATSPGATGTAPPLCRVMDSAFLMVTNAVKVEETYALGKEQLLATTAPLIQLVATLCYSADKVEFAFSALPPTLLQQAFFFSASLAKDGDGDLDFKQNRLRFLDSFARLTRVGDSRDCRSMIREALEQSTDLSGPTLLLKVLAIPDLQCNELVLNIAADLLKDAPVTWAWSFAHGLERLGASKRFDEKSLTYPLARVFNGLVGCLGPVVFSRAISDVEAESYLTLIWSGVVTLSPFLSVCLSNVSREPIPLKTVASILDFFSSFLQSLGPIMSLHESVTVQSTATGIRDAMVEMLALTSNLGESVVHYALLPISLSVGCSIEAYAQERNIIEFASMEESNSKSKYGLWRSTASGNFSSPTKDSEAQLGVGKIVDSAEIDFEMIQEKGGAPVEDFVVTAKKALRLLRLWAMASTGAASSKQGLLDHEQRGQILSLSPARLLTMVAAMPQSLRTKKDMKNLWDSANPTNLQLITRYLDVDAGTSSWPLYFPATCLDMIHACIVHGVGSQNEDMLLRSSLLSQIMILSEKALVGGGKDEERKGNTTLGILSFRVLCCSTGALAPTASPHLTVDKLMANVFVKIRNVADKLHKARESHAGVLGGDEPLLDDLQITTACIRFLAAQLEGKIDFAKYYDNESASFSSLAKVILQQAHTTTKGDDTSSGVLFSFLAAAVDFLRLATEAANSGLMRVWQDNSIQLISMPKNFMSIESCGDLGSAIAEFSSYASSIKSNRMVLSNPASLLRLFPITAVGDSTFPEVDVSAITRLLSSLDNEPITILKGYQKHVFSVASSHHTLTSQLALLCQWRKCIDVLVRLSKQNQSASASGIPNTALAPLDGNDKFLLSALETLRVLRDNVVNIEVSQTSGQTSGSFLRQEQIDQMAQAMAGLVLQLVAESIERSNTTNPDLLTEVLGLISICAMQLFGILSSNAEECSLVEKKLLASAIGILNVLDSGGIVGVSVVQGSELNAIANQLVGTVSELFKLFKAYPGCSHRRGSIKTCVVLLSVLAAKGFDSNRYIGGGRSNFNLSKIFNELHILDMLVSLASSYSVPDSTSVALKDNNGASEGNISVVESIVDLFLALSDSAMLLYSSGALSMLTRNPLFDRSRQLWSSQDSDATPTFSLRGYVPTKEKSRPQIPANNSRAPLFAGKDDPLHIVWRNTLRCLKVVLRSSRQDPLLESSKKQRLETLMADFIVTHRPIMLACLKNLESSAFTKNALVEATLTMSLLQEFCAKPCRDRKTHQLISDEFLPLSIKLVARLGSFLGASAGARDFFNDLEDESEDAGVNIGARHSPFPRVYNARHEAIRYSHFASRCSTAVTSEDFNTSISSSNGTEDLRSATALEKHGKELMTCEFARAMEQSAAECMFSALSLVWEMHPTNSSFHLFTSSELGKIDVLPLIKPGMVVAFCSDRESKRARRSGPYPSTYVHFAKVQYCDTVERVWYVRDLDTGGSEIVQEIQILGLEETGKKQFLTKWAPAPDSATELESSATTASVGHLILALRWCVGAASPSPTPLVKMLAGLSSCVLGAEMSMHDEIGSVLNKSQDEISRLDLQLLDLYGNASETVGGSSSTGADRLKVVLGEKGWNTIRQQLEKQLIRAEEAENANNAKNDMMVVDDGLLLRSSGRNPFASMAMNLQ